MRTAVIVDVVRTPSGRGKPGGALSGVHPVDLAAGVLRSVLERNGLESRQIDDVLLGLREPGRRSGDEHRPAGGAGGRVSTRPFRRRRSTGSADPASRRRISPRRA